jgi:hypothetical protein
VRQFVIVKEQKIYSASDHPPLSSAMVKERVELYIYTPFGPS